MAARHTTITCAAGAWTPLSDGAVAAIRLQRLSNIPVYLQATLTNVAPASHLGALEFGTATLGADVPLSAYFSGVGAGPYYVWAWATSAGDISVSHA